MKPIFTLVIASLILFSCKKETSFDKPAEAQKVTTKTVTVDFRQVPGMNASVDFYNLNNTAVVYTFAASMGSTVTKNLPAAGNYRICTYYSPSDPGCNMYLNTTIVQNGNCLTDTLQNNYLMIMMCH